MSATLRFEGAARNVTGSRYILDVADKRLMIDCGFFQERDFRGRNWDRFPTPPDTVDAVLLTHAHLDHCGLLPKLVAEGFEGPIYCTAATADITRIILLDSAHIQEEDAEHKRRRHEREGRKGKHPCVPLYTEEDARAVFPHFSIVAYSKSVDIGGGVSACFRDAGHILGSATIRVAFPEGGETRSIVFSGDVGRWDIPILCDPIPFEDADYMVMESTYGDRMHGKTDDIETELAEVINATREAGGNIIIPSFAVERTQELLFYLQELLREDRIPHIRAFVDSPMAIRVTEVFRRHPELFDEEAVALLRQGRHPCHFPGLTLSRSVRESKSINHIRGTVIIIAGSGMCTGGRVKHHLVSNISRPESTVLFVGYQAVGTLGRVILEGTPEVRIHGREFPVEARIEKITGFSAHADQSELLRWVGHLKGAPRRVFVTHGEEESAQTFAALLEKTHGWRTQVPTYEQTAALD